MMRKSGKRCAVIMLALMIAASVGTMSAAYAQEKATAAVYVTHGNDVTVAAADGGGYRVTGSVASNCKFAYNQRVNTKAGFGVDITYNFDLSAGDNATRWFGLFVNGASRDENGNVTDGTLLPSENENTKNGIQIMFGADAGWSTWGVGLNVKLRAAGKVGEDGFMHQSGYETATGPEGSEAENKSGAWVAWALRNGKTVHYDFADDSEGEKYIITLGYAHTDGETYSVAYEVPYERVGNALSGDAVFGAMQQNSVSSPAAVDYTVGALKNKSDIFGISIAEPNVLVSIGGTCTAHAEIDLLSETTSEDLTVSWSSDDETIATVNDDGVIAGIAEGTATVRAALSNGMTAEVPVTVSDESFPILGKWETAATENAVCGVNATENGNGVIASGKVGGGYASADNKRDAAKFVYNVPIDLNAATAFDITLNLDLNNFTDDAGNGDKYRSFAIVLNQSARMQNGKVDASKLDKVLDLDGGIRGVQVAFAKAGTWGEWAEGLRWETYDTAGALGANHFHTTNTEGINSIPDLPSGDEKFELARKISNGETFRVKIEKKDDELHFTAANVLWRFPLSEVAFTDENNVYLAFVSDNGNGVSKVDFRVENLYNGFIKNIAFKGEQSELALAIDETHVLVPNIEWKDGVDASCPEADDTVIWSTDNADVATVKDGVVTALKPGRAVIRATTAEGKYAEITVIVPANSVTLDITEKTVKAGKGFRLTATADPAETAVTFESSNPEVATVNANGDVVGVAAGSAEIYAYAGDKRAVCVVTVEDYSLESLAFTKESYTFAVGESVLLEINASDSEVPLKWRVSDETVAEITSAGYVFGKAAGTVTVTVTGGGKTATCTVTFTDNADSGDKKGCGGAAGGTFAGISALLILAAAILLKKRKAEKERK